MLLYIPPGNTSMPDTDLKYWETLNIFPLGKSKKTVMVIPEVSPWAFPLLALKWWPFQPGRQHYGSSLGDFFGGGGSAEDVYWVIWDSKACAAHSGAAWRIFSKRLLTWKHRDWICLSHVGRGSRAARDKIKEQIRRQGIKHISWHVNKKHTCSNSACDF